MYNKRFILIILSILLYLLPVYSQKSDPLRLDSFDKYINCVDFSSGGSLIAYSDGNIIRILNLENGSSSILSNGRKARVLCLDISPDSSLVVSGDASNLILIHDLAGKIVRVLDYHSGKVTSVKFDNTGDLIYSGSTDKKVICYNLVEDRIIFEKEIHKKDILTIDVSKNGKLLASGGADGKVNILDASTGDILMSENTGAWIRNVIFNNFNNSLNAVNDRGRLLSWNVSDPGSIAMLPSKSLSLSWVTGIDFLSENDAFIFSTEKGLIKTIILSNEYKYRIRKPVRMLLLRPGSSPFFSLAVATWGKGIIIIDSRTLMEKQEEPMHFGPVFTFPSI